MFTTKMYFTVYLVFHHGLIRIKSKDLIELETLLIIQASRDKSTFKSICIYEGIIYFTMMSIGIQSKNLNSAQKKPGHSD